MIPSTILMSYVNLSSNTRGSVSAMSLNPGLSPQSLFPLPLGQTHILSYKAYFI